ncbi:MAG: transglycosylase SLT domain-containing protein [Dokdonella sp.]|uniref:lytic transglycosylase domain-containing protein n=1 Tax=Dokdonella sp. TaxID=2291710 RepID=UPI003F7CD8C1
MPSSRIPAATIGIALLLLCPAGVRASVLYKCDTTDGSIAYTSTSKGYSNCKAIASFADPPKAKPSAAPAPVTEAPASARAVPRNGWTYEEHAADFSTVEAAVASEPSSIMREDFRRVVADGASSAPPYLPQDFSTVLADVASSAATVGNPLFIAAPYRAVPVRARPAVPPTPAVEAVATTTAPVPRVLRGAVYRVQRKNGITEYTNIKPSGGAFAVLFTYIATCVACDIHSKIDFARTALHLDAYKAEIAAAAAEFGLDSALLHAVIHAESAFNPMALSNKGAQGLMQLMPGTATDMGVADAFDAYQNIRGGARYLAMLLKNFNGDARLATAAYNAGPGAVQKYGGVPPYDETQVYVERVATLRDRYAKAL